MSGTHVDELSVLTAASLQDSDVMYVGVPTDALDPDRQMTITEARKIFAFQDQANTFEQDLRVDAAKAVEFEDTDGTAFMRVRTASGVWKAIPFPSGSPDYGAEFSNDLSTGRWWFDGGVGIGSSADANHLGDYEEGTYTPEFSAGFGSVSYGTRYGAYTRVGNIVHVRFRIATGSQSSPSGGNIVVNLPFSVVDSRGLGALTMWLGLDTDTGRDHVGAYSSGGGFLLYMSGQSTSWAALTGTDLGTAGFQIIGTLVCELA